MSRFWQTILFVSVWSIFWISIPGYFATRAIRTGRIYDDDADVQWITRADDPQRFWRKVIFYYALALIGLAPWVLIMVVGIKE